MSTTTDQPAATDNGKGLYSKLAEVTSVLTRVEKRGHNDFHNYDYVTEGDLVDAVRGELTDRGIAMLASADEVTREDTLTSVKMTFKFVDGETGETHTASWFGTGEDKGDKGLYKAYTGAIKYFLMKTFLIPTGDDPEQGSGEVAPRSAASRVQEGSDVPSAKQLDFIASLAKDLGADGADQELLRAYASTNLTGGKEGSGSRAIEALKGDTSLDPAEALVRFLAKAALWAEKRDAVPADAADLEPAA